MAKNTLWSLNGKIIVATLGRPILCDVCPCGRKPSSSSSSKSSSKSSSRSSSSSGAATNVCDKVPKTINLTIYTPVVNAANKCTGYTDTDVSTTSTGTPKCERNYDGSYEVTYNTAWGSVFLTFSSTGSFIKGSSTFGGVYKREPDCLDPSSNILIWT